MPHTVNGFGTWYWGKTHVHSHLAACEHCGQYGRLISYDTRLYVTALYLPLIPLGKRKVVDECPACRKHRSTRLRKWNVEKRKALAEAHEAYERAPGDPQAATQFIGTCIFFEDDNLLLASAEPIERQFAEQAEVNVAMAMAYAYFGFPDAAVQSYERSLAAADAPDIREALAVLLLHLDRPADAEVQLAHVLDNQQREKVGLIELTVQGYQQQGMHDAALALLDRTTESVADLADHKPLRKLRTISEANRQSGKAVKAKSKLPDIDAATRSSSLTWRLAPLLGPVVIAVLVIGYVIWAWSAGQNREVFVVNGLDEPYAVQINGRDFSLQPKSHHRIELSEGPVEIEVHDETLAIEPATVTLSTPFLSRPFNDTVFVINPDRVAILLWEQSEYALNPATDDTVLPYGFHIGRAYYEIDDIDYAFRPFPPRIKLPSRTAAVTKNRLDLLTDAEGISLLLTLHAQVAADDLRELILRRIELGLDSSQSIRVLSAVMEPGRYVELLRSKLNDRPVDIEWHRSYQDTVQSHDPQYDLAGEYGGYLAETPDDTALLYLLGRVTRPAAAAEALFERSTLGQPPSAYGFNALAFSRLTAGRFEEALQFVDQALAIDPANATFVHVRSEALHALGRLDDLIDDLASADEESLIHPWNAWPLYLFVQAGQSDRAAAWLTRLEQQLRSEGQTPEAVDDQMQFLRNSYQYFKGDVAAIVASPAIAFYATLAFEAALLSNDLEAAAELEAEAAELDAYLPLLGYALAESTGRSDASGQILRNFSERLADVGDPDVKQVVSWLKAAAPPDDEMLHELALMPAQSRIVLLALGARFTEQRSTYWSLAEKLNYNRHPPYLAIRKVLKGQ